MIPNKGKFLVEYDIADGPYPEDTHIRVLTERICDEEMIALVINDNADSCNWDVWSHIKRRWVFVRSDLQGITSIASADEQGWEEIWVDEPDMH